MNTANNFVVEEDPVDSPGCCESALDYSQLPDACTNDLREERLIQRQAKHEFDNRNFFQRTIERERNLIIASVVLAVALNLEEGRYILYPFKIFSTWVHEMCHGIAAILTGGYIDKLQIFKDGSGLAFTAVDSSWKRGFVASAGYSGTACTGCLLLLFRRTTLGPTIGTIGIGICMALSCALWVRNTWGLWCLLLEGIALILLGWKLPAVVLDNLYNFLAATCCLNAVESIQDLFAAEEYYVGGEVVSSSDAHTVAEKWGMDYRFWAVLWLWMSFILTFLGIVFAFDAKETKWFKGTRTRPVPHNEIIDAEVVPVAPAPSVANGYPTSVERSVPSGQSTVAPPQNNSSWFGFS